MQKQPHGTGITGTAGLLSCCAALRPAAGGDVGVGQLGAGVHDLLVNGGLGQGGGGRLLPVDVRAVLRMSQFSCSSVMPGICFFTSSRFMVETPFVCETSVFYTVLCQLSGLGRDTRRPPHGAACGS